MNTTALTLAELTGEFAKPTTTTPQLKREDSLSRRIAWSTDGWFITLRTPDAAMSRGLKNQKHTDIRVIGKEVVAGPFQTKEGLLTWFFKYLETHGTSRDPETRQSYLPFKFGG